MAHQILRRLASLVLDVQLPPMLDQELNARRIRKHHCGVQRGVSVIVHCSTPDVTLRALRASEWTTKMFGRFGIKATSSDAGLVTNRLIAQMGGIQGCRVFKITGVRKLIAKYSPDQAFTRSAAIQLIRDVDPDTNIPSFQEFESLFIAARELRRKLTPQDVLDYLLEHGVFRVGLEFRCRNCELAFWQSIDDVKTKVECQYCGSVFDIARQLRDRDWAFRRSGLFGRNDQQRGGIPVAVTLQQLDATLSTERRLFSTSLLLTSSGETPISPCETDFVMITSGYSHDRQHLPQVVIGECKARGAITPEDARNLAKIADALPYRRLNVFIVFAKLGEFSPDEVEACGLAQHKWRARVILLSERELEPYALYGRHAKEPRLRTTGLEDLAQNTTYLYPALRPKGFLEIEAAFLLKSHRASNLPFSVACRRFRPFAGVFGFCWRDVTRNVTHTEQPPEGSRVIAARQCSRAITKRLWSPKWATSGLQFPVVPEAIEEARC